MMCHVILPTPMQNNTDMCFTMLLRGACGPTKWWECWRASFSRWVWIAARSLLKFVFFYVMNFCVCAFPPMVTCGWGTHVLSVTQVGRAGGCESFAGGCSDGKSCSSSERITTSVGSCVVLCEGESEHVQHHVVPRMV